MRERARLLGGRAAEAEWTWVTKGVGRFFRLAALAGDCDPLRAGCAALPSSRDLVGGGASTGGVLGGGLAVLNRKECVPVPEPLSERDPEFGDRAPAFGSLFSCIPAV